MRTFLTLLLVVALGGLPGVSPAIPYSNYRQLPSSLDMFETGLYWMRDWFGPENNDDPATILTLMEEQAARHFDFGHMAAVVAGPRYWSQDILSRSHFQRDLRDWLFAHIAQEAGLLDKRPVRYWPVLPRRLGPYAYLAGVDVWRYGVGRVRLLFHFAWTYRGWRIQDVSLNGRRVTAYLRANPTLIPPPLP